MSLRNAFMKSSVCRVYISPLRAMFLPAIFKLLVEYISPCRAMFLPAIFKMFVEYISPWRAMFLSAIFKLCVEYVSPWRAMFLPPIFKLCVEYILFPAGPCSYLLSLSSYLSANPPVRSTIASIGIPPSIAFTFKQNATFFVCVEKCLLKLQKEIKTC